MIPGAVYETLHRCFTRQNQQESGVTQTQPLIRPSGPACPTRPASDRRRSRPQTPRSCFRPTSAGPSISTTRAVRLPGRRAGPGSSKAILRPAHLLLRPYRRLLRQQSCWRPVSSRGSGSPRIEALVAIGVDEMSWDDLDETHYDWPVANCVTTAAGCAPWCVVHRANADRAAYIPFSRPAWVILMGMSTTHPPRDLQVC